MVKEDGNLKMRDIKNAAEHVRTPVAHYTAVRSR